MHKSTLFKSKVQPLIRERLRWFDISPINSGGVQMSARWLRTRFCATNDVGLIAFVANDFMCLN